MPLFEIGYRRYEGRRTSARLRWWPIARSGVTIAWRSKLLRRLVLVAYLPILYFGPVFFAIGRITDPETDLSRGPWRAIAEGVLTGPVVAQLRDDPTAVRTAVWALVFTTFASSVQLALAALVAAVVGPVLISQDLRSKAFLLYFSRPISSVDYLLGKAGTLAGLLATVTLLPCLLLYALSIAFSPSLETVAHTFPVLLDVVLASLAVVVPATLVMLVLSSLTRQARFATVAWAVVCAFGVMFHQVIRATRGLGEASWPRLLSLGETVRAAQLAAFDVEGRFREVPGAGLASVARGLAADAGGDEAALFLVLLSVACTLFLLRRVSAPTRI
jgi:hypothetical protein